MKPLVYADCKKCKRPVTYRKSDVTAECDKYCAQCWNEMTKSLCSEHAGREILHRDGLFRQ